MIEPAKLGARANFGINRLPRKVSTIEQTHIESRAFIRRKEGFRGRGRKSLVDQATGRGFHFNVVASAGANPIEGGGRVVWRDPCAAAAQHLSGARVRSNNGN